MLGNFVYKSVWFAAGCSCLFNCMQMKYGWDVKTPEQLYNDCMATFADEAKCTEFVSKETVKPKAKEGQYPELTEEQRSKLLIRQDLKDRLQYKNKLYVKNLLGEPDEILSPTPSVEEWLYTRPLTVYEMGSPPDREFRIRFQKGNVQRVTHKSPLPTVKQE